MTPHSSKCSTQFMAKSTAAASVRVTKITPSSAVRMANAWDSGGKRSPFSVPASVHYELPGAQTAHRALPPLYAAATAKPTAELTCSSLQAQACGPVPHLSLMTCCGSEAASHQQGLTNMRHMRAHDTASSAFTLGSLGVTTAFPPLVLLPDAGSKPAGANTEVSLPASVSGPKYSSSTGMPWLRECARRCALLAAVSGDMRGRVGCKRQPCQ